MKTVIDSDIVAEEDRLTQATRGLDVEALDRLYADEIMFTGVTGVICNKTLLMDEARRGVSERQAAGAHAPAVVSYEKDDLHGVRHGDTAVTSYRFGVTVRHDGQETVRRYRTTNVWMRRGGRWQVVAAHTAGLPS
jgi:ketosteroid isomerase-like protein